MLIYSFSVVTDIFFFLFFLVFFFFGGGEETEGKRTGGERKKAKNISPGINLKMASAARQSRMSIHSAQNRIKK